MVDLWAFLNDWGVVTVEDWAEIRRLHRAEGMTIAAIAHRSGIARITVKCASSSMGAPTFQRAAKGSAVDQFELRIRALRGVVGIG